MNSADDPVPKLLAETEHYIWCRERLMPGDTALDVGSNIGLFSTMFAKMVKYGLVGTVHAIEASPTVFRDLQLLVKANNLDNVVVWENIVDKVRVLPGKDHKIPEQTFHSSKIK